MRVTDKQGLTVEQQARLAAALTVIRSTQSLRGWSQWRHEPDTVRLLKHVKGKLALVYYI